MQPKKCSKYQSKSKIKMEVFNREQDDRHKRAACAVGELKLAVVKHFLLTAIELNANAGSGPVDCRKWKQRVM